MPQWEQKTVGEKIATVVSLTPIINYFYFAFYYQDTGRDDVSAVSVDSINAIGNTVGLVAALLYTVMTALPTGVSYDELATLDGYWKGPTANDVATFGTTTATVNVTIGKYGCQWSNAFGETLMSVRLGDAIADAAIWLVLTILMAMVIIVSASTLTRVRTPSTGTFEVPEAAMEQWWKWMRWATLVMTFFVLFGVLKSLNVMNDISYIKFPHPWLRQRCADAGWTETTPGSGLYTGGMIVPYYSSYSFGRVGKNQKTDPLYSYGLAYLWGTATFLGMIIVAGYAQYSAHTYGVEKARVARGRTLKAMTAKQKLQAAVTSIREDLAMDVVEEIDSVGGSGASQAPPQQRSSVSYAVSDVVDDAVVSNAAFVDNTAASAESEIVNARKANMVSRGMSENAGHAEAAAGERTGVGYVMAAATPM